MNAGFFILALYFMNEQSYKQGDYIISTDIEKLDVEYIHDYLSRKSYWAADIPIEAVRKSIQGSFCFGVYDKEKQIGFARVITDKATFGYLADVFIDEGYRGKGLSKWLMSIIMSHSELQGFRNWMLGTRDAHSLYEKFGFRALDKPEIFMRKNDPEVYKR